MLVVLMALRVQCSANSAQLEYLSGPENLAVIEIFEPLEGRRSNYEASNSIIPAKTSNEAIAIRFPMLIIATTLSRTAA